MRSDGSEICFMTLDPSEHHQVVFATGRPADLPYNMIQQLSFRAENLAALREKYAALKREQIVELGPLSHGNAISAYFRDPEGNRLEVFVDTKWHVPQPCAAPLDLTKSEDEITAFVEKQVAALQGAKPRSDWERERAPVLSGISFNLNLVCALQCGAFGLCRSPQRGYSKNLLRLGL